MSQTILCTSSSYISEGANIAEQLRASLKTFDKPELFPLQASQPSETDYNKNMCRDEKIQILVQMVAQVVEDVVGSILAIDETQPLS
jgi:hypothetical protein